MGWSAHHNSLRHSDESSQCPDGGTLAEKQSEHSGARQLLPRQLQKLQLNRSSMVWELCETVVPFCHDWGRERSTDSERRLRGALPYADRQTAELVRRLPVGVGRKHTEASDRFAANGLRSLL